MIVYYFGLPFDWSAFLNTLCMGTFIVIALWIIGSFRDPDEVQQRQELDWGDSCPECGEALSVSRDFVVFCPSCGWEQ